VHPKAVRIEWTPTALANYSTRSNRQTAAMGGRAHGFDRRLQAPVFVFYCCGSSVVLRASLSYRREVPSVNLLIWRQSWSGTANDRPMVSFSFVLWKGGPSRERRPKRAPKGR